MFVALVLSVMSVGSAMASSEAMAVDHGPGRVKVDVRFRGDRHASYAEMIHLALCPECRVRSLHADPHCYHKPHPPKGHKDIHNGGGKHRPEPRPDYRPGDGNKRPDARPGGRPNDRGNGGRGYRK